MNYTIYKIKSGKLDQWKKWCETINTHRRNEAIATIKQENLSLEAFLIFNLENNNWYTLGIALATSEGAKSVDNTLSINQEHKKQKSECLDVLGRGESVYCLENF